MSPKLEGVYHYFRNGEQQPVSEPWQIQHRDNSFELTGSRIVQGHAVLNIAAEYNGHATCTGISLTWQKSANCSVIRRKYSLREPIVSVYDEHRCIERCELPAHTRLFPLLRAGTGFLLRALREGQGHIALPRIGVAPEDPSFLGVEVSPRQANRIEEENGQNQWRFRGGPYGDEGACFSMDGHDIVQRYEWRAPDGHWLIELAPR